MYWFAEIEDRIASGLSVGNLLKNAEQTWNTLDDEEMLMEERRNDGSWIRIWRRALIEYNREIS